jgi:hypothetical protein
VPTCFVYHIDSAKGNCAVREESNEVEITAVKVRQDLERGDVVSAFKSCENFVVEGNRNVTHSFRLASLMGTIAKGFPAVGRLSTVLSLGSGADTGLIHLMLTEINTENNCSAMCQQYQLHIAYKETISEQYLLLEWNIGSQHSTPIVISQIAHRFWIVYISRPEVGDSCLGQSCPLHFRSKTSISNADVETNVVAAHEQLGWHFSRSDSRFSEYHLLSWTAANAICKSIGMQLASITTEDEYDIVKGLLWGQGYRAGKMNEDWITTPCRVESAVCMVFLGLHLTQVGVQRAIA